MLTNSLPRCEESSSIKVAEMAKNEIEDKSKNDFGKMDVNHTARYSESHTHSIKF